MPQFLKQTKSGNPNPEKDGEMQRTVILGHKWILNDSKMLAGLMAVA